MDPPSAVPPRKEDPPRPGDAGQQESPTLAKTMAQPQADAATDTLKAHNELLEHLLKNEQKAHEATKAALETEKATNELQLRYRDSKIRELENALAAKGTTALLKDYLRQEGDKPMGVNHVDRLVDWLDRKLAAVSAEVKSATTQNVPPEITLDHRQPGVVPEGRTAGAALRSDNGGAGTAAWTTIVRGGRKTPAVTQLTAVPAIQTAEQRRLETLAKYNITLSPEVEADIAKREDSSHVYETSEVAATIYVQPPASVTPEKVGTTLAGLGDVSKVIYDVSQIGKNKNVRYEVWVHPACVDIVSRVLVNVLRWPIEKGYDPSQPAPTVRNDKEQVDGALARVISRYNHLMRKTKSPEVRNAVEERLARWGAQRASLASFFAKPVPSRDEAAKQSRPQKRKMVHSPVRPTGPAEPTTATPTTPAGSFELEYPMLRPPTRPPSSVPSPRLLEEITKNASAAAALFTSQTGPPTTDSANVDMVMTEMEGVDQSTQPPPSGERWGDIMAQHEAAEIATSSTVSPQE